MSRHQRERVTVDLRGRAALVQRRAAAQGVTVASLVRQAVLAAVEAPSSSTVDHVAVADTLTAPVVKVTVRLLRAHAVALATRAHQADVSQGAYVGGLLDGTPAPVVRDRAEAVAALLKSTDQLALISMDIRARVRLLRMGSGAQAATYRDRFLSLADDVHSHLAIASRLLTHTGRTAPTRSATRSAGRRP
jgi:hypothetical protein